MSGGGQAFNRGGNCGDARGREVWRGVSHPTGSSATPPPPSSGPMRPRSPARRTIKLLHRRRLEGPGREWEGTIGGRGGFEGGDRSMVGAAHSPALRNIRLS